MDFDAESLVSNSRESLLRRPEWEPGAPIAFPNGDVWHFYRPTPVLRKFTGHRAIVWNFGSTLDSATLAALDNAFNRLLGKAHRARNDRQRAAAALELAWFLLARNYLVSQADFETIMAEAGEAPDLWAQITCHIQGVIESGAAALDAEAIFNG